MYLEISPRQSGKTYRLINTVLNHIAISTKDVIIFTYNSSYANYLKQRFLELGYKVNRIKFLVAYPDSLRGLDLSKYRLFFDEFDFYYSKAFWIDLFASRMNFKDAYFCTTAKRLRTLKEFVQRKTNDPLIKLLRKNNHIYTSMEQLTTCLEKSQRRNLLTAEHYLTEVEGLFVK